MKKLDSVINELRDHNNKLDAVLMRQAISREHASEREALRIATARLKRWNDEQRQKNLQRSASGNTGHTGHVRDTDNPPSSRPGR